MKVELSKEEVEQLIEWAHGVESYSFLTEDDWRLVKKLKTTLMEVAN